jgi:ferredoxin-thioredoxin reductase catalytic subunit
MVARKKKTKKDTRKFVEMVVDKQGWKLVRDDEFLGFLIEGLKKNYNRYGYFLCPCRDSDGKFELDKDIVCPCDYAKPDIEEYGHCYCGLYLSPEFWESEKEPTGIPERRPLE